MLLSCTGRVLTLADTASGSVPKQRGPAPRSASPSLVQTARPPQCRWERIGGTHAKRWVTRSRSDRQPQMGSVRRYAREAGLPRVLYRFSPLALPVVHGSRTLWTTLLYPRDRRPPSLCRDFCGPIFGLVPAASDAGSAGQGMGSSTDRALLDLGLGFRSNAPPDQHR